MCTSLQLEDPDTFVLDLLGLWLALGAGGGPKAHRIVSALQSGHRSARRPSKTLSKTILIAAAATMTAQSRTAALVAFVAVAFVATTMAIPSHVRRRSRFLRVLSASVSEPSPLPTICPLLPDPSPNYLPRDSLGGGGQQSAISYCMSPAE